MRRNRIKSYFDRAHEVMRRPGAGEKAVLQRDFCVALAKACGWPEGSAPIVVKAMAAAAEIALKQLS